MRHINWYYFIRAKLFNVSRSRKTFTPRAANSIFVKISKTASSKITLQLVKGKCIPILITVLKPEASQKRILYHWILSYLDRLFIKLFRTTDMDIVRLCQECFNLLSDTIKRRTFMSTFVKV